MTFVQTQTQTFTITHARYLTSKLKTDLKLVAILYPRSISDREIDDYGEEIAHYINAGYLAKVRFGFKRNGIWIPPSLDYTAAQFIGTDNHPGGIASGRDVANATFTSYLWKSDAFWREPTSVQEAFKASLPVKRTSAEEAPSAGTWSSDNSYSTGGRSIQRIALL